jgi:hypothetical protein
VCILYITAKNFVRVNARQLVAVTTGSSVISQFSLALSQLFRSGY